MASSLVTRDVVVEASARYGKTAHCLRLAPSHSYDHTAQREKFFFDGSFVQHTKQKTEPAKAQITGRDAAIFKFAVKSAIFQVLSDRMLIIESIASWKNFVFSSAGAEVAHVEFVKPLRSHLRGQHGVPVAARRLKQQQPTRLKNPSNLPMACHRLLKMFRNVVMKCEVKGFIRERQSVRCAGIGFI